MSGAIIKAMVENGYLKPLPDDFFEDMGGHIIHESNIDKTYFDGWWNSLHSDEQEQYAKQIWEEL